MAATAVECLVAEPDRDAATLHAALDDELVLEHTGTRPRSPSRRHGPGPVLFSITAEDWPQVRAGLRARLAAPGPADPSPRAGSI